MEPEATKALRVEAEAIQKLPFPHPWLDPFTFFKFKFIDFKKKLNLEFNDFAKVEFKLKFINNS